MATRIAKTELALGESLGLVEAGERLPVDEFKDRPEPLAQLIYGILIHREQPELAKDLCSKAASELTGEYSQKARIRLAICYSYTGEVSEGLAVVNDVLSEEMSDFVHFQALLAKATLKTPSPKKAWEVLQEAKLYESVVNVTLQGLFHVQRGRVLKELERYDDASVEYDGAAGLFERAGNQSCAAMASNNLASVYCEWKKYPEAHEAVSRAIKIYTDLRDPMLPYAKDQKAQILIAEGRAAEAEKLIDRVIAQVRTGDKKELLCECLLTNAKALVKLHQYSEAFHNLEQANKAAQYLSRPDLLLLVAMTAKKLAEKVAEDTHKQVVQLALDQSAGLFRDAAIKLGITHQAVIRFVEHHGLSRKRKRPTSLIGKAIK